VSTLTQTRNRELFADVYREKLRECVRRWPERYYWPVSHVNIVAERVFAAMDNNTFHHNSPAFRRTARALGIKPTRKALLAFWKGET